MRFGFVGGSLLHARRDDGRLNCFDDFPMTLLVPVLILAILVLAWVAWLAFGPWSSPVQPIYFLHMDSHRSSNCNLAVATECYPGGISLDELQRVRIRLTASNGCAASLSGNALHVEIRPGMQNGVFAMGRCLESYLPQPMGVGY